MRTNDADKEAQRRRYCTTRQKHRDGNRSPARKFGASERQRATCIPANFGIIRSKAQVGSSRFFVMANYSCHGGVTARNTRVGSRRWPKATTCARSASRSRKVGDSNRPSDRPGPSDCTRTDPRPWTPALSQSDARGFIGH